jgi:SET domain-containing protein
VTTSRAFKKGEFLLEYVGERVTWKEGEERMKKENERFYFFFFKDQGKKQW